MQWVVGFFWSNMEGLMAIATDDKHIFFSIGLLHVILSCIGLNAWQMDGFDQTVNVKVIMATNRADTLDPALLRPGRLDRKIEFPLPDRRQKRLVFQVSFDIFPY